MAGMIIRGSLVATEKYFVFFITNAFLQTSSVTSRSNSSLLRDWAGGGGGGTIQLLFSVTRVTVHIAHACKWVDILLQLQYLQLHTAASIEL